MNLMYSIDFIDFIDEMYSIDFIDFIDEMYSIYSIDFIDFIDEMYSIRSNRTNKCYSSNDHSSNERTWKQVKM